MSSEKLKILYFNFFICFTLDYQGFYRIFSRLFHGIVKTDWANFLYQTKEFDFVAVETENDRSYLKYVQGCKIKTDFLPDFFSRPDACKDLLSALASATGLGQRRCLHCLAPFHPDGNGLAGLVCPECLPDFLPYAGPACQLCGLPGKWQLCPDCAGQKPAWAGLAWSGIYAGSLRDSLLRLKFDGELALTRLLGFLLAKAAEALPGPDLILAVPQHPRHLRQRGFNQAHELARELVRQLDPPLPWLRTWLRTWTQKGKADQTCSGYRKLLRHDLLLRIQQENAQARLGRAARQSNVSQSFVVRPEKQAELAGKAVWLVDDIMTTGSTLAAASNALLRAGAGSVWLLFVARTPRKDGPQSEK